MYRAGHLSGGAELMRKFKIGATVSTAGAPIIDGTAGVIIGTTTDWADTVGLGCETATYSTTQGDAEGLITVSVRSDLVIRARMSGGATAGTALTILSNTSASAGGTTVTDADVGTASFATGIMWCIGGANVGHSRIVTTFNSAASAVVTVPFPRAIAVGDTFLWCPYAKEPGTGTGNVQGTTGVAEADASIASGTGGVATVVDLELNGAGDSYVSFILQDHLYNVATI